MFRRRQIERLIRKHHERLQVLKEQKASFGLHTPPYILLEITETEREIERLEAKLETIKSKKKPPADEQSPVGVSPFNWEKIGAIAGVISVIIATIALIISPDLRSLIFPGAPPTLVMTPSAITTTDNLPPPKTATAIARVSTEPAVEPTRTPTASPTDEPTFEPSDEPTSTSLGEQISNTATAAPLPVPTDSPTPIPSDTPTAPPSPTNTADVPPNPPPDMVHIPAGSFFMGSLSDNSALPDLDRNPEPDNDEFPQRTVNLPEYWIDRTEVTNARYRECVNDRVCPRQSGGDSNYHDNPAFDNFPVIFVWWDDANTYCEWAGKRLPTEAEWEKAARGTEGLIWPWGNFLKDDLTGPVERANVGDSRDPTGPKEVGSYPAGASPYGVLDMSGNVWEWVSDWYSPTYYAQRPDPDTSPPGPAENESTGQKVIRGGSFNVVGVDARTADRNGVGTGPSFDIGFRCAWSR